MVLDQQSENMAVLAFNAKTQSTRLSAIPAASNARERRRERRKELRIAYHTRGLREYANYAHKVLLGGALVAYCDTYADVKSVMAYAAFHGVSARPLDPYAIHVVLERYVPLNIVAAYFEDFGPVALVVYKSAFEVEVTFTQRISSIACFAKGFTHRILKKKAYISPVFLECALDSPKPWSPARKVA